MCNELFIDILNKATVELKDIEVATLSGFGEFSMDPFWREKITIAKKYYDKIHIVTNLSNYSKDDLIFLLNEVNDIRISCYATSAKTFNKTHKPKEKIEYEMIENNINYLVTHKKNTKIILNYLEYQGNVHETEAWIKKWKPRADLIEVWKPHNWVNTMKYRDLSTERNSTCGRPLKGPIQIQVDGTVVVCCFDYNGIMNIGDLTKNSFEEIFFGCEMTHIQELHSKSLADEIELCKTCDQRNNLSDFKKYFIYNSLFSAEDRIGRTSTEYKKLS